MEATGDKGGNRSFNTIDHNQPSALPPRPVSETDSKADEVRKTRQRIRSKMMHFDIEEEENFASDRHLNSHDVSFLFTKFDTDREDKPNIPIPKPKLNIPKNKPKDSDKNEQPKPESPKVPSPIIQEKLSDPLIPTYPAPALQSNFSQPSPKEPVSQLLPPAKEPWHLDSHDPFEISYESPLRLADALADPQPQLSNVYVHKAESKEETKTLQEEQKEELMEEHKEEYKAEGQEVQQPDSQIPSPPTYKIPKLKVEEQKAEDVERIEDPHAVNRDQSRVIELNEFDFYSPFSEKAEDKIKFHRSPRNLDDVQFIDKLNRAKEQRPQDGLTSKPESVEGILGRIPREYFRVENRYESIDAVLDHITRRREHFMNSINSSPHTHYISKTIEPIVNSVSPHAREVREKFSTAELYDRDAEESLKSPPTYKYNMRGNKNLSNEDLSIFNKGGDRESTLKLPSEKFNDEKHITFDKPQSSPVQEQEAGNLYDPENEIINFETNDNPEFKLAEKANKFKKKKRKKGKKNKHKGHIPGEVLNDKMKEIDEIIQPLGEGVYTDLLDFNDMHSIPLDKKKELKLTKEDQEYFAGTKKNLFTKKCSRAPDKFAEDERPKLDD